MSELFGRTPWAAPRGESDVPKTFAEWQEANPSDAWGAPVTGAATPPPPTLQSLRLSKALLEGDILALVRRFEEAQGVGVESVEVHRTDVTTWDSQGVVWRPGSVRVVLERL